MQRRLECFPSVLVLVFALSFTLNKYFASNKERCPFIGQAYFSRKGILQSDHWELTRYQDLLGRYSSLSKILASLPPPARPSVPRSWLPLGGWCYLSASPGRTVHRLPQGQRETGHQNPACSQAPVHALNPASSPKVSLQIKGHFALKPRLRSPLGFPDRGDRPRTLSADGPVAGPRGQMQRGHSVETRGMRSTGQARCKGRLKDNFRGYFL